MNREQAREVLIRHRPENGAAVDIEVAEALALANTDDELREWLRRQTEFGDKAKEQLRRAAVPEGLRSQIRRGQRVVPLMQRRRFLFSAAASIALLAATSAVLLQRSKDDDSLQAFRQRMLRFALREYRMDILSQDEAIIQQHLRERKAPTSYELPPKLAQVGFKGGAALSWHGHPVSMVCFERAGGPTLFLFVISRNHVRSNVPGGQPEWSSLSSLRAATWSRGENIYVLAGETDAASLAALL